MCAHKLPWPFIISALFTYLNRALVGLMNDVPL